MRHRDCRPVPFAVYPKGRMGQTRRMRAMVQPVDLRIPPRWLKTAGERVNFMAWWRLAKAEQVRGLRVRKS